MEITVRKPTEEEKQFMQKQGAWGCDVSQFDWYYDSKEIALMIEGEVTVTYGDQSVSFGAGDYVEFPQGLSCVWKVSKPVRKYYIFE